VVSVLQVRLLGALPESTETDSEAYSHYLQGKHYLDSAGRQGTLESEDAFRKALSIDPEFAPAWAGLSRTLRARANWGQVDLATGTEEARKAALKALSLDDTLADAWAMLAHIQWVYDWDWNAAEGTARTALLHGPHDARALEVASNVASSLGHFEDSLKYAMAAVEVDPLNPYILRNLGLKHWAMERYDLAEDVFRRALDLYPDREGSHSSVARFITLQGRPEEAWQLLQAEKNKNFGTMVSVLILHDLGRTDEARQANQYVIDNAGDWLAYQIVENFAYMGDVDAAFQWLEITLEQRDGGMTYILGDPTLTALHNDPRWEPFLLKVGLLDAWNDLRSP
jgi:tetratricopeptide (TPR) repeat protein